jgi:LuxR family maltose regulon positive regulatory protein
MSRAGVSFTLSYAQNQLEEAANWLHQVLRIAHDWRQAYLLAQGEIGSMRLALARGELSAAHQALLRIEALLEQEEFPHYVLHEEYVLWKVVSHVEYWLASRNLTQAQAWATQHLLSAQAWDFMHNAEMLMLVQVLLAVPQYSQAVDLLSQFREPLSELGDIQTTIHYLALSVVALSHAGRREEARHSASVYIDRARGLHPRVSGCWPPHEAGTQDAA